MLYTLEMLEIKSNVSVKKVILLTDQIRGLHSRIEELKTALLRTL